MTWHKEYLKRLKEEHKAHGVGDIKEPYHIICPNCRREYDYRSEIDCIHSFGECSRCDHLRGDEGSPYEDSITEYEE